MKRIVKYIIPLLTAIAIGCSTTSRIPDGEYLYTGLKGVVISPDTARGDSADFPPALHEVLTEAVDVPPTQKLFYVFPVGLWVYNNMSDSVTGLKKKFYDKYVRDPVLVSEVRPQLRTKMLDEILDNNGYFSGTASYELVHPSNPKKASILYTINPGNPYPIDSLILLPESTALNHTIDSLARADIYLSEVPGVTFCLDSLNTARTRITNKLRNRGYYYFSPEFIEYLADTIMKPGKVVMKLDLASNIPTFATKQYITGDVTVRTYRFRGGGTADTFDLKKVTLIQMMPSKLRHSIFDDNVTFRKGRTFSVRQMNNTQSYLSRLGIFQAVNIDVIPDSTAKVPTLDVNIGATFDAPWEASLEVNATSKSNSYIGPGLNLGITNHNTFGGGEQLSLKLTGSYEWQTGRGSNRSVFNSYEAGLQASLAFPRMLAPAFIPRRHRQLNWTRISMGANLLNRPHYFKTAQFNTAISYDWQSTRYVSNSFTPFKLTYNKLMRTTEAFDSMMIANPAIALSFQSQFIPQMSYQVNFDRTYDHRNNVNLMLQLTEAGNVFWSVYELCGYHEQKKMFGTPFSQFVKGVGQAVWGHRLAGNSWLVSRVAVGAAHAYANSSHVPYSEQFYCGGANSVRAFAVRSIGPGSYHDPNVVNDYFDQTGTFKFEANVEYRFPIYGPLNGAVFLDSGNVWLLREDPLRPGGLLRGRTFFKDLATGTGAGLRFDIGMLVLRGDLGIGIHAPYDTGRSGYYNMTSFKNSLAFHLAIGYPF
ncbi:MAG: BamA/TamA family outer membrane protein [Muribaculaceae bacterium]|nr:BamA/TamA family outer membrane protein [Muribaculaceae bacterium]